MEKYSDLCDKLTELQVKQNSEIGKLFNEILEEYKNLERRYNEVEKQCIDYETSIELGIGYEVLQYGKIYNVIVKANTLEECLKNLDKLYSLEVFEIDSQLLSDTEDKIFDKFKKYNYNFREVQSDLSIEISQEIIDSVLGKAK